MWWIMVLTCITRHDNESLYLDNIHKKIETKTPFNRFGMLDMKDFAENNPGDSWVTISYCSSLAFACLLYYLLKKCFYGIRNL